MKIVKLLYLADKDNNVIADIKENNLISAKKPQNGNKSQDYDLVLLAKGPLNNNKLEGNNIALDIFTKISNLHSFIISILTLSILFFILKPSILLNSTQLLSLSLYNF